MLYKDKTKSTEERIKDLISRMTLEEKVAQLCATLPHMLIDGDTVSDDKLRMFLGDGLGRIPQFPMPFIKSAKQVANAFNEIQKFAVENTRFGIPIMAQVECLNGVSAVDATSFPAPIAMASTFEPHLVKKAGYITGQQMRAMTSGSNALSPVVDIARDPRWGRVYETYGECSYMNSIFGSAYVKGLQNDGDLASGVQSCAKHFLGYSYSQGGLNCTAVEIGERDLYESFAKPFEAMIHEADLRSVMCTYSEIDGVPVSASKKILRDLLRDKLGFSGSAICDGGSIERLCSTQHTATSMKEAGVMALVAGLDADAPISQAFNFLPEAVRAGEVDEKYVDDACKRVLKQKFDLGLFDNPYVDIDVIEETFNNDEGDKVSLELSAKSITLLKNVNNILPLEKNTEKIGIIGPHGDSLVSMFAGYTFPAILQAIAAKTFSMEGVNEGVERSGGMEGFFEKIGVDISGNNHGFIENYCRQKYKVDTILQAVSNKTDGEVFYSKGCNIDDNDTSMFDEALEVANKSDVIIMTMGGKCGWANATSGEGQDRASIDLPGVQEDLLKAVASTGKPVILILFNGRPMSINWAAENVDAILEVWFTGPQGGRAIADVLFGDTNPGGKLPITIPRSVGQVPIYYNHKRGSGYDREQEKSSIEKMFGGGYTDISSAPLYPFGYGLSYTEFEFVDYDISKYKVDSNGEITVSAFAKNIGGMTGDEVVQLYIQDMEAKVTRPVKELIGFKRINLQPNEMKKVSFNIKMSQLGFLNEDMELVVEPGNMKIMIGNSSKDIYFTDTFEITGEKLRLEGKRTYFSNVDEETVDKITKTEHVVEKVKRNYSIQTTLGVLLDDEDAKRVLENTLGEAFIGNPRVAMARNMPLEAILKFAGDKIPKGVAEAIDKMLNTL